MYNSTKLGYAGIVDTSVKFNNASIIIENLQEDILFFKQRTASVRYFCVTVGHHLYHRTMSFV